MKRKTKRFLKNLLNVILVIGMVGVLAGILGNIASKSDKDGYVKVNPTFEIGALNVEDGSYVVDEGSLYTKDMFDCKGLIVTPDFDAEVKYTICFYDENGNFIQSTETLTGIYDDELPEGATQCRIMITPVWDEDVKEDDQVIKWYQKSLYTNQLTIEVLEDQSSTTPTDEV